MDIFTRLRILLWGMVLSLWGMFLYDFLKEDSSQPIPVLQSIRSPFPRQPVRKMTPQESEQVVAFSPAPLTLQALLPARRLESHMEQSRLKPLLDAQEELPPGFVTSETSHFVVHYEGAPAPPEFKILLESLHTNLMLDLSSFSPWAAREKVTVFLFNSQKNYQDYTGRPEWSGGASSVRHRRIYVYKSEEVHSILAHELCHIYFDGFFLDGTPNPLWLSEGMATLIQAERGLAPPNWLRPNLEILQSGGGYPLKDFMRVEDTSKHGDASVRLWYAQAYSLVHFLLRTKWSISFYKFCTHLKEGEPVYQALYKGYGLPFSRLEALEYTWRYDLKTGNLTKLSSSR